MNEEKITRRDFLLSALRALLALLLIGGVGELTRRNTLRCREANACKSCPDMAKCPIRKTPVPVAERRVGK